MIRSNDREWCESERKALNELDRLDEPKKKGPLQIWDEQFAPPEDEEEDEDHERGRCNTIDWQLDL